MKKKIRKIWRSKWIFGTFLIGLLILGHYFDRTAISFSRSTCQVGNGPEEPCTIPFRARSPEELVTVRTTLKTGDLPPALYHINLFGCITEMEINGEAMDLPGGELCSDGSGITTLLEPLTASRENRLLIRMKIRPPVSQFAMRGSRRDPVILTLTILLMLHVLWFGAFVISSLGRLGLLGLLGFHLNKLKKPNSLNKPIAWIFLLGVILRILYVSATPYSLRSYDWQGHIEYFRYVADRFTIPPAQLSWEMFQPPLTYFLGAAWMRLGQRIGRAEDLLLQDLQVGSFLLSVAVLAICVWIARIVFPNKPKEQLMFVGLSATFPGLIVWSSRLTNDTTYHFFAFLFFALLLHFWKTGNRTSFITAAVITGLGMLTKSHALLFIPIAAVCLFFQKDLPWKKKILWGFGFLGIVLILCGWLLYLRFVTEGERFIVGNVMRLDPIVLVPRGLTYYLIFNPLRILEQIFISNVSGVSGRPYFLEYFFRSAHFGSFHFGAALRELSGMILLTSMLFIPVTMFGMARKIRKEPVAIPMLSTIAILLAAQCIFRWIHPHATGQDFRFSILLLAPFFFFLIRGMALLPARWQPLVMYSILASATLGTLFPFFLFWSS
ncbi:glycosyltransferase family 39 protein [Candidatus Peregrinibacteria bacterium]|nr:glycosyltransferase family 39 protein [Candidatus Peregrinibacteria bacterium]